MTKLLRRLLLFTLLVLVLSSIFVSISAGKYFEASLTEQRVSEQREVARSVIATIEKALTHGVPYEKFVEAESYLEIVNKNNPGVDYIALTGPDKKIIYSSDIAQLKGGEALYQALSEMDVGSEGRRIGDYFNISIPIDLKGETVGWMNIGAEANFVEQILFNIALDILTVLIVAALVAFQMLGPMLTLLFSTPLKGLKDVFASVAAGDFRNYLHPDFIGSVGRLNRSINNIIARVNQQARAANNAALELPKSCLFDLAATHSYIRLESVELIRWPFFLVIFSESLSLSFFPTFVGHFHDTLFGLPRDILIGLPITLFMLVWTVSMPYSGTWCDKIGYRRAFGFGAMMTTIGLVLTAFSAGLSDLLIWRSLTAVGYGTVYVTTQAFIINKSPASERTRGNAMFQTSFFAGSLSGAAIGGILVDRLGYQLTFLLSGTLSLLSALYVIWFLAPGVSNTIKRKFALIDVGTAIRNREFGIITILAAIPAKIALAGFLYYSMPIYLKGLGFSQSLTGRVMMVYGLSIILVAPIVAKLADQRTDRLQFVVIGGFIAALAMAVPDVFQGTTGVILSMIGLGVGHAICVSAQMTLINDRCGVLVEEVGQASTIAIFRLIERTGSILGPIIFGTLITFSSYSYTFAIMAIFSMLSTSIIAFFLSSFAKRVPLFQKS
jgi:MFS family permease